MEQLEFDVETPINNDWRVHLYDVLSNEPDIADAIAEAQAWEY